MVTLATSRPPQDHLSTSHAPHFGCTGILCGAFGHLKTTTRPRQDHQNHLKTTKTTSRPPQDHQNHLKPTSKPFTDTHRRTRPPQDYLKTIKTTSSQPQKTHRHTHTHTHMDAHTHTHAQYMYAHALVAEFMRMCMLMPW